jgi:hypothetical protein
MDLKLLCRNVIGKRTWRARISADLVRQPRDVR